MSSKPTDSQELKLGPGWTSLSKNTSHPPASANPSSAAPAPSASPTAPRIAYTKAQLLDLYEPGSTATIPPTMTEFPGLTSSEPLVPVNIAPNDDAARVSSLAENASAAATEPSPPRTRFQANPAPRPGVEAILRRDHPQPPAAASSPPATESSTPSAAASKKSGHVTSSGRDFWSGSAVLAAAERPTTTGATSERRPLMLKPRSTADRAASPNGHPAEKPTGSQHPQPYWSRGSSRGGADSNSNWRGGISTGGAKYPGSSLDDVGNAGNSSSVATSAQNAPARKSSSDLMSSSHFSHGSGLSNTNRPTFGREGGLFSRNNKEALKPTNTRDLTVLAKGSNRDSTTGRHDREHRESRQHNAPDPQPESQADDSADNERIWFYRDPQGATQGPFTASQLVQWEKEGYYDSELPVSKSTNGEFKPLAIAFGMRKEDPPVAAPPPGFNGTGGGKKDNAGASSPMSMRPSREERNRRGSRTVEDMAKEVEKMRIQKRNKRNAQNHAASEDDHLDEKDKSFFDEDSSKARNANGHDVVSKALEQTNAEGNSTSKPESDIHADDGSAGARSTTFGKMQSTGMLKPEPPVKQSRFAAIMKQDDSVDIPPTVQAAASGLSKEAGSMKGLASSGTGGDLGSKLDAESRFEGNGGVRREEIPASGAEQASTWNTMMMGLQQQQMQPQPQQPQQQQQPQQPQKAHPQSQDRQQLQQQHLGAPTVPTVPAPATEPDLMAIDPAIAHASFSHSAVQASSGASPRANSSGMPSWLSFTAGADAGNVLATRDSVLESRQRLQTHPNMQVPLAPQISQQQAQLQVQVRAQAEARARAEAYRQAQLQAQVQAQQQAQVQAQQQAQVQAQQQAQVQAQQQAQVQAQQQAQVQAQQRHLQNQVHMQQAQAVRAAAQQASVMAQAQAQSQSQDAVWLWKQRVSQLQVQFDAHFRANMELGRTAQTAQATLGSSRAGSIEHDRARMVLARTQTAMKEHNVQMDRIKYLATSAHAHIMQQQTAVAAAREQQQRQLQVQTSLPSPESHGTMSPHSITKSETHSPKQPVGNGPIPAIPTGTPVSQDPLRAVLEVEKNVASDGERIIDDEHTTRRNLNSAYDAAAAGDGWEKVTRHGKEPVESPQASEDSGSAVLAQGNAVPQKELDDASSAAPGLRHVANGRLEAESEAKPSEASEAGASDSVIDPVSPGRSITDTVPTIAPWSKSSGPSTASNGLSLREIQREELRSKAEERTTPVHQEREEATKAPAVRWNHNVQPWGGAGDASKQPTMSLREIEEEQKKKKASHTAREAATSGSAQGVAARPQGTKTGWASIAAKNSTPVVRRPTAATVVGKRMDEDTPFWDSVGGQTQGLVAPSSRPVRPPFSRAVQAGSAQSSASTPVRPPVVKPAAAPATGSRRAGMQGKQKGEGREANKAEESVVIGGRISNEFGNWIAENVRKLTGAKSPDTTLFEYLVTIPTAAEITDTLLQNLGSNDSTRTFADEFVRRLEFERTSVVADAGAGGNAGRKKGRRHRPAKVDPSLVLGFTSTSSRIMQGTIETPEMK